MDSLGCFGIRNSDKFILHFNQVCFQIYRMAPPYRRQRQRADAPFTAEQEAWLILEYGAVKKHFCAEKTLPATFCDHNQESAKLYG